MKSSCPLVVDRGFHFGKQYTQERKDVLQFRMHEFPKHVSFISHAPLALMFIYYRYKSILTKLFALNITQGRYLHMTTHAEETRTDIHISSRNRTHDPGVQAGEHISYLRPRGHCDRLQQAYAAYKDKRERIKTKTS
jgi:hypothetical protein